MYDRKRPVKPQPNEPNAVPEREESEESWQASAALLKPIAPKLPEAPGDELPALVWPVSMDYQGDGGLGERESQLRESLARIRILEAKLAAAQPDDDEHLKYLGMKAEVDALREFLGPRTCYPGTDWKRTLLDEVKAKLAQPDGWIAVSEGQIKYMADRFLGWRLPENFNPDGGISFKRFGNEGTPHQYKNQPTGTNLLGAEEAEGMVRFMVQGIEGGWKTVVAQYRASHKDCKDLTGHPDALPSQRKDWRCDLCKQADLYATPPEREKP